MIQALIPSSTIMLTDTDTPMITAGFEGGFVVKPNMNNNKGLG